MRENRAANLFVHATLGEDGLAFGWMIRQFGMDLPIEVVQKRCYGPFGLILLEFSGIGHYAGLHRERMAPEPIGLREFTQKFPSLFSFHCDHSSEIAMIY